ncbi:hypothetical protein C0J52_20408 [Blattella germanica]|nr:hypothetical protein C0J52_20408 [Blattella germanica]
MCFVVGYINNFETRQSSAKTNYHWQIFKCRQLIFTEPEILASPVIGKELAVYIVMTEEFYKSSKLQTHLEKLNMNSSSPEPVTNLIYEACFRYTLIARISPLWNQIDNCLVQGRDFLINASFMNAIKFEMIIRDESMFLSVWPLRVKLPLMKKEHLDLNQNSCDQYVHVLPRMKKCYLRSISSDIPMTCPYKSYKELKRHWKNMYGYRLPEDTDQVFYCSVSFSGFGSNLYTYPSVCVRRNNLLFLRHTDHMDILQNFLADINKKFPNFYLFMALQYRNWKLDILLSGKEGNISVRTLEFYELWKTMKLINLMRII